MKATRNTLHEIKPRVDDLSEFRIVLGKRLRQRREERRWSQRQTAAHIGLAPSRGNAGRVSRWENGFHLTDLVTLHRFATAFDLSVSELLEGLL